VRTLILETDWKQNSRFIHAKWLCMEPPALFLGTPPKKEP
jgi:hypothetical protein